MSAHRPARGAPAPARDGAADRTGTDDGLRTARPEARTGSQHPLAGAHRPHVAARLEDALDRRLAQALRYRGWTVRIEPYPGYGAPGWLRIMARTLLAAPVVPDQDLPGTGAVQAGAGAGAVPVTRQPAVRGWRSYLTVPVAGAAIEVVVGDQVHRLQTDRGGYVDQVVACDLPAGWHEVTLRTQDGVTAVAPVQVVDPSARLGLVSDVDDTVMVTHLPRPLVAAWNVLVRDENAREAVPGMAEPLPAAGRDRARRTRGVPVHRRLERRTGDRPIPAPAPLPAGHHAAHRLGADQHRLVPLRPAHKVAQPAPAVPRVPRRALGAGR